MLRITPDRMLHNFRLTAGLPSTAVPLGGLEAPMSLLRGHWVGHYLSGCALLYASTGDAQIKARGDALVTGIAECQAKLSAGGCSILVDQKDSLAPNWNCRMSEAAVS